MYTNKAVKKSRCILKYVGDVLWALMIACGLLVLATGLCFPTLLEGRLVYAIGVLFLPLLLLVGIVLGQEGSHSLWRRALNKQKKKTRAARRMAICTRRRGKKRFGLRRRR